MTYFEMLDLPIKLDIDEKTLQKKFYELSKKTHPDFFVNASHNEKEASLVRSTELNHAFKTLRDKTKRLHYVANLFLGEPTEQQKKISPELLMDMMELSEKVYAYASSKSLDAMAEIETLIRQLKRQDSQVQKDVEKLAALFDKATHEEEKKHILQEIRQMLFRRKYYQSLFERIGYVITNEVVEK